MNGKTVVVTGANSGIGEATARELARAGSRVALVCRSSEKGQGAVERIRGQVPRAELDLHLCDLSSFRSVREVASSILAQHPRLDVLVNNAGLYLPSRQLTEDGLEATVQINHFGPFLLTSLLAPRLIESGPARIINVSSEAHRGARMRFEDLQSEKSYRGFEVYGMSKLMNILHARALAKRLDPARVTANALHPGVVATGFAQDEKSLFGTLLKTFGFLLRSPSSGAKTTLHLVTHSDGAKVTGRYFSDEKEKRPTRAALDDESAERLWAESERLTGAPAFPHA
ncbi:MAG: SDR family oxidoreductase [Myxococcota bacterium]